MNKALILIICAIMATAAKAQHLTGGDISLLPAYEKAGTQYLDSKGKAIKDLIPYLQEEAGMNAMRVRLFVTPTEKGGAKSGVVQDLNYVQKLGKRIKDAGLRFMLDFHYSDYWADPARQEIPSTWAHDTSNEALTDSMYSYTRRCLLYLKENGAAPDYVQIGNEITYGMLWRNNNDKCYTTTTQTAASAQWKRLCGFLNAGAKAVREVTPQAKIIIHTERSCKAAETRKIYQYLATNKVDYDVIGLSYYPFFHGYLNELSTTLTTLSSSFPEKEVQIVETAYYHSWFPSDATVNTSGKWAANAEGQSAFISDLIDELVKHDNVKGVFYWFPEEAGNGKNQTVISSWLNRGLWWPSSQWPITQSLAAFKRYTTTGVDKVVTEGQHNTPVTYTLSGQRVSNAEAPGVYIRDGKKIVIRK